jgi:FkbM family methyltransferase
MFKLLSVLKKSPLGAYFFNNRVSTIRFGIAKGLKRKGGLGIFGLLYSEDSKEDLYIRRLPSSNKVVYDIGANFGAFTLYFLKNSGERGRVVAFEPIKKNCDDILENVRINKLDMNKLTVIPMGLGSNRRKETLTFDPMNTSRASFDAAIGGQIKAVKGSTQEEIEVDSLDNVIVRYSLPNPDFVKIDVEGFESEVLRGMTYLIKSARPQLLIEMHGIDENHKQKNACDVVGFLESAGYSMFHIETECAITKANSAAASSGHLHCTWKIAE